jgi:hypothetical protein
VCVGGGIAAGEGAGLCAPTPAAIPIAPLHFRVFTLVDDFSRECLATFADTSISGVRVVRFLEELGVTRGLAMDRGSYCTAGRHYN